VLDLSIIIVNSNTCELLRDCLRSVTRSTIGIQYEVIVVDNNSADGSANMVETEFPCVKLVRNSENLGFSKGNNQGFEVSSGKYILMLNSDTLVFDEAVNSSVRFMDEHPEAGAVGCRTVDGEGELQLTYERFPTILSEMFRTTPLSRLFPHNVAVDRGGYLEVDWVQGSFLMLRRAALSEIGMLDEMYSPAYSEETDLCYRLKKAGWRVYYVPDATIVHFGGQTTKSMHEWHFLQLHRSKFLFFKKHRGRVYAHTYRLLRSVMCLIRIGVLLPKVLLRVGEGEHLRERLKLQWHLFCFLSDPGLTLPTLF
jgi:GT2 family glycosyltransferase